MPDFTIKQGDTLPILFDALSYADGSIADLTGAAVTFVMRSPSAVIVNASAAILSAPGGIISYTFTATDTATPGQYTAEWVVVFGTGQQQTWPTAGYLEITVEENLTAPVGLRLVSLAEAKDVFNIPAADRTHDAKVLRRIAAITPIIENVVGICVPRQFDEWYDGGQAFLRPRHRPILSVQAVTEYRGPIAYPLFDVQDPAHGTIYSFEFENNRIVRRSPGGGIIAFPYMPQSIHVVYTAGRDPIPPNIVEGTLELLRLNYQKTQQQGFDHLAGGGGGGDPDDQLDDKPRLGFFVPGRVREMLQPNKRAPSVA